MRISCIAAVASLAILTITPTLARASGQAYVITLTNLTNPAPNSGQPFSPPVFLTHDGSFTLFTMGDAASPGVRQVAEEGDNNPLLSDINTQLGTGVLEISTPTAGPLLPGKSVSFGIRTDSAHPFLSSIWMLGRTNDGFSGLSGLDLSGIVNPVSFDLFAYDAGTEVNNESALFLPALGGIFNDPEHGFIGPHPGIRGDADAPLSWGWNGPVARVTIAAAPEPGALAFFVIGGVCLAGLAFRARRAASKNAL